jgi:hypothetical protein
MDNTSYVNFHGFGSGDAGGPIDCRVDDLCNHVGFTDVAAQAGCWWHFEEKNSQDSRLREEMARSRNSAQKQAYFKILSHLHLVSSQSDH